MATQYVIVGGGLAAASAVEGIRDLDADGPITLITAERELPYHRPPLSKGYLAGRESVESVRIHDAAWYRDQKVRVRLGQPAKSVHLGKQSVTMVTGERVSYDRLLVATGSTARKLGVPGQDTPGLLSLRTLADAGALRRAVQPGSRLLLVGGGFIGMEVAATARAAGAEVTVLEAGPVVYGRFASPELSAFFQQLLESRGIALRMNTRVARVRAEDGRLAGVETDGGELLSADTTLVGVGAEPNTAWLAASGFAIERNALSVNLRLETPGTNVWAAGDIVRFPDPVSRRPRRLEHWDNAMAQGRQAGRNMAGAGEPYTHLSAFFSDLFDLTINVLGDTDAPDHVEIRGSLDLAAPRLTALDTQGGALRGAVMVNVNSENRLEEFNALEGHIRAGTVPAA